MAQSGNESFYYRINKGLFTEGGYLSTPVEAWRDAENVVPQLDGTVARRKGIDAELDFVDTTSVTDTNKETLAFVVEHWNSVAGDGARNFIVVQKGPILEFYDNLGDGVGGNRRPFTVDLTSYKPASNPNTAGTSPIQTVSGNGKLVVVSADSEPIVVTYDETTNTISVAQLDLKIRDFEGLISTESGTAIAVDHNPATLDASHNYNLLNQGWLTAHITTYHTANSVYPSNSQQWVIGKDSLDVFQAALLDKHDFGTSPAPRGRFILDIFSKNYTGVSGVGGIASINERYRPETCAFFAGRIWYAGMNSDQHSTWVLFSRVARTDVEFGQCHQVNDPTAEIISDLVDSDGGVIPIQDAGTIKKILPLGGSMIVFADNGVWQILSGSDGFSASSYSVHKISSIGIVSSQSVMLVGDTCMYCGTGGIYALTYSDSPGAISTGTFSVKSVSDDTIKSKYEVIPPSAKKYIRAVYNEEDQIAYFLYSTNPDHSEETDRFVKDSIMAFDTRIGAWYIQKFYDLAEDEVSAYTGENTAVKSPKVYDLWLSKGRSSITADFPVIETDLDEVIASNGDAVVSRFTIDASRDRTIKFWASRFHRNDDRSTYGTRYNSAGTLTEVPFLQERHTYDVPGLTYSGVYAESAGSNLALSSEELTSGDWSNTNVSTTRNSSAGPDGTTTMDTVGASTGSAQHYTAGANIAVTAAESYIISAFVKVSSGAALHNYVIIGDNGDTNSQLGSFDLSTGSFRATNDDVVSTAVEGLPGSIYRISVKITRLSTGNLQPIIGLDDSTTTVTGTSYGSWNPSGPEEIFAWGLMVEQVTTETAPSSYIPTRNLVARSEELDNASWTKTDITVSADSTSAPNAASSADLLTEGTAGTAIVTQAFTLPAADVDFTASVYVKLSSTTTYLKLACYETAASANTIEGWVRLDDGNEAAGSVNNGGTATGATVTLTAVPDRDGLYHGKWYRIELNGNIGNSATACTISLQSADADSSSTQLNNAATYVWGAQVEARSATAGYWGTVSALTGTRAADSQVDYWKFVAADWHNARQTTNRFKDWVSLDANKTTEAGTGWVPFLESGHEIQTGAGVRRIQAPAITTFTLRTEEGLDENGDAIAANSVFLQTKWDWADGANANKWSVGEQVYKPRMPYLGSGPSSGSLTDHPVVTAKTRVRGAGKTLQFKYYGEAAKDFRLIGWAAAYLTHTPTA
jgi:hypothetical protein